MNEPRGSFWRRLGCGEEWCGRSLLGADSSPFPQYSQKEDKYEEEIKILTDKLKEVSWGDLGGTSPPQADACCPLAYPKTVALSGSHLLGRRRPAPNSPNAP